MKHPSFKLIILTEAHKELMCLGQWEVGSLSGALAS